MATCLSCGREPPGEFPFCPYCGAPLTVQPAAAVQAATVQERKVVSVLFCDLVGFTARSDKADPEDVGAMLRPYHVRLRAEIERFGGTLDKFIGDAVMAVFGIPAAHEDDPERAVRCALRILDAIAELNAEQPALELAVRIGVNSGEALVNPRPGEETEGVVGDVVNTASRLQGAAPVNGIAVSEQTYRQTERIFEYEPLEPVQAKGKAGLLALFRPLAARARFGTDVTRWHATPLVGRELERPLLTGTFERAAQQRSCQLVTIVGEPGVGKSRLCEELFAYIDDRPGLVRWRQGRCLPYGEGIAFWALGEIVKAECSILESDTPEQATAKLEQALPADERDRPWLLGRLAPLVGAGGEPASQEESFTAWRRFLESLAVERETVLVFEDLHWADAALLAFLKHLADWSQGVPLLLLCTARPELHEQHPAWAAGLRNATTINLAPLTDEETARLLSMLLERTVLPAETQQALLERAGGIPLYAEEFVRLLQDRDLLSGAPEDVQVPDSVHAVIAARLDTLSPERKSLLQDAAVVGKVFWAGAVAAMGDRDPREVEMALHELTRKELVRPARTSSLHAEQEYAFLHLLVRDVCYAQIPRAARAARHRAAAAWLERGAGERAEDLVDVLAHHYLQALELARAAGQSAEEELRTSAIRYLALSGERALALDVQRAEANYAKALALAAAGHPERAWLLERWAQAAREQGRPQEARAALDEALALYRTSDPLAAGRTLTALSNVRRLLGDPRHAEVIAEALALLEAQPPGPELAAAHAQLAGTRFVMSAYPEATVAAERALALAVELGLPEPASALGFRGGARAALGERQGLEDMRRALALAVEQGQGRAAAVLHANLALMTWQYEGPQAAHAACQEGIDFCERRGIAELAVAIAIQSLTFVAELGRSGQVLAETDPLVGRTETAGDLWDLVELRSLQLRLRAQRGEGQQALAAAERLIATARESGDPQILAMAFAAAAQVLLAQTLSQQARALLVELEQTPGIRTDPYHGSLLPEHVRSALAVPDPALARALADGFEPRTPILDHARSAALAQLTEAAGEHAEAAVLYAEVAGRWREFGNVPERAYALLGQGRCLATLGKSEAGQPLRQARQLFASLEYRPALAATQALLGPAEAAAM